MSPTTESHAATRVSSAATPTDVDAVRARVGVEFLCATAALLLIPVPVVLVRAHDWLPPFSSAMAFAALWMAIVNTACVPALVVAAMVAQHTGTRRHLYAARCAGVLIVLLASYGTWSVYHDAETLGWSGLAVVSYVPWSFAAVALCLVCACFAKFEDVAP